MQDNEFENIESLIKMAISRLAAGRPIEPISRSTATNNYNRYVSGDSNNVYGYSAHDYSHLLPEAARQSGYSMTIIADSDPEHWRPTMRHVAEVHHRGRSAGFLESAERAYRGNGLEICHSDVEAEHRNKGLGKALYLATMAHAKHVLGKDHVYGDHHSSMASRTHQSIEREHKTGYKAIPNSYGDGDHAVSENAWKNAPPAPYDKKFSSYEHSLVDPDEANTLENANNEQDASQFMRPRPQRNQPVQPHVPFDVPINPDLKNVRKNDTTLMISLQKAVGDPNSMDNGESGPAPGGVEAPQDGGEGLPDAQMPQYNPAQINEQLLDEIHHQITKIDPKIFQGVVQEIAELIEEFKGNLPQFQMLQFTAPDAYNNLITIVNTLAQLAQLMLLNGDLPTDQDVVSKEVAQDIQGAAAERADASGAVKEEEPTKPSREVPIGTRKTVMQNGVPKVRVKTPEGWKYAQTGYGGQRGQS